jgi:predicted Zn-dependent protease
VITLEAINASSGEEIARQQSEAESKEQVLKSLSSAASGIREKLGESLSAIQQSDIPLYQLTTPSLEALKSFALGFDRSNKGEYFESIPLFKHAVELDPNFAYGYSLVAGNYIIMSEPRRAAENATKAFALKDKVTDREKLYITYAYDNYALRDLDKAAETLRLYNQSYPNDFRASGNLSLVYQSLGQFDKSYEAAHESVRLNPGISAWQVTLGTALLRLDRFAEAKTALQGALQAGLNDPRMHATLYQLAFIDHDTTGMQQQLDWARNKPEEFFVADLQTAAAACEGRWQQSQDLAQRAIELAARVDFKEVAARFAAEQGLRAAVLDRCEQAKTYDAQSLELDHNQVTLERIALAQALCGAPLQSSTDELAKENPSDTLVNRLWLPIIRAAIEFKHGNAAKTIELLNGARSYEAAGDFWPQYLRGQAYLKLNKGAEAIAEFQSIRDHRGLAPLSTLYPLANYGLGAAAALQGDKDDSLRSYESFLTEWKDADRDLLALVEAQRHANSGRR